MAQEKRPWWSITLWGGKKTPPSSEPEAKQAPAPEPAPVAEPAPRPQAGAQDVSHAFEDLMARYEALLGQSQSSGGASMAVVHRLLTEAEREAANLKIRARRQAEVEAAPLLAEAKRQAQETIAQANREAQRITEQQVGSILDDAHQKAALIEERAKQAAQVFLMRCREDVQTFVAMEAKEAFYKLLAPVNEVLATAQEVESTWKMRAVDLWQSAGGQLEDYQSTLFGSLGTGAAGVVSAEPEPLVHETGEVLSADEPGAAGVVAAEAVPDETEVIAAPVITHEGEGHEEEERAAAEQARDEEAPPQVSEEAVAVEEAAEPEVEEPKPEEPDVRGSRSGRSREPAARSFTPVPPPDLYEGELSLLIEPYTNVAKISKFYRDLGTVAGIRVLRTAGTWDKGTVITVELNEPLSPQALDQRLPSDVQATPAKMEDDGWWKSTIGRRGKGSSAQSAVAITFATPGEDHEHASAEGQDAGETHDHDHDPAQAQQQAGE